MSREKNPEIVTGQWILNKLNEGSKFTDLEKKRVKEYLKRKMKYVDYSDGNMFGKVRKKLKMSGVEINEI